MKQSMHLIVRAAITAAVVTLASGSALAASNLQVVDSHSVGVFTASGGAFGAGNAISPTLWQVKYDSNTFLAFCLDPHVGLSNVSNNYSSGVFAASDAVKKAGNTVAATVPAARALARCSRPRPAKASMAVAA